MNAETKKFVTPLISGALVLLGLKFLGGVVPAIYTIPVVEIGIGSLLIAGVAVFVGDMLTRKL